MRCIVTLCLLYCFLGLNAQTGCPDCVVELPDTLAMDALYLDALPNAQAQASYDQTLSFRLPMTTTPVAETGLEIPAGLNISRIEILNILNVPPGLNWELSQSEFMVQEETDGCLRFCGTPLIPGLYEMEVILEAGFAIFNTQTSLFVPILVEPAVSSNDGFTLVNNSGCGSVTVDFINNNPSDQPGFEYSWDFGESTTSEEENPAPLTYTEPGDYEVSYQAIVDTSSFWLTGVNVLETGCSDLFGGLPDLKINVFDTSGMVIYTAPIVDNAETPLSFSTFIELGEGNYSVQVVDDDSGLGGADDDCGTVSFTRMSSGVFNVGDLQLTLDIFHPIDTINAIDTVSVFAIPEAPILDPAGNIELCTGDSIQLLVSNYDSSLTWFIDGQDVGLPTDQTGLFVAEEGSYSVRYLSAEGCTNESELVVVSLLPAVPMVPIERADNAIRTVNSADVPPGTSFQWLLDGQVFDEESLRFCPTLNGTYTLLVTDEVSGCTSESSIEVTDADQVFCDTPVEELLDPTGWSLFPNPSPGLVRLQTEQAIIGEINLELIDLLGRQLWQQRLTNYSPTLDMELDWTDLAAGSYRLLLRTETGLLVLPVIRQ